MTKNNQKQKLFIVLHFILPLFMGACIYFIIDPNTEFAKGVYRVWGWKSEVGFVKRGILSTFLRNYALDMLWGYALVFALYYANGCNAAKIPHIFCASFLFSILMELFQWIEIAEGVFDFADIVVEGIAEGIAAYVLRLFFGRR